MDAALFLQQTEASFVCFFDEALVVDELLAFILLRCLIFGLRGIVVGKEKFVLFGIMWRHM